MEMPEAWIILNSDVKELRADGHITDAEYVHELLQLSKEMAESIETLLGFGFRHDLPQAQRDELRKVMEIMRKFKEWK